MKYISVLALLVLVGCGDGLRTNTVQGCLITDAAEGALVECGGESILIPDGANGSDGEDAVLLTKTTLSKNSCEEVYPGIYGQNINGGNIFDIYLSSDCKDSSGFEQCDNINTIRGATGSVSAGQGSGTVCWVEDLQFSGVKQDNGDILVYILEF